MHVLSAIPVILLAVVAVWFLWPVVADPIARLSARRSFPGDADTLSELLFEAWGNSGHSMDRRG